MNLGKYQEDIENACTHVDFQVIEFDIAYQINLLQQWLESK